MHLVTQLMLKINLYSKPKVVQLCVLVKLCGTRTYQSHSYLVTCRSNNECNSSSELSAKAGGSANGLPIHPTE